MRLYIPRRRQLTALVWIIAGVLAAWLSAQGILQGANFVLIPLALILAAFLLLQTLKSWRTGVLLFITWMLFEDLVRKNLGNNMAVFFAKDVLAIACCLSFYAARHRERMLKSRPAFFFPFVCFFFWGLLEVFNPNSTSPWFGLLGLKLYFGYAPLFILGYALIRNESDLRRFLSVNMVIASLISILGVMQAITGRNLLSPAELAPDIRELGSLVRAAPVTGETFLRPPSVFVSDGRFGSYLLLAWLLSLGAAVYFFVRRSPGRRSVIAVLVLITTALVLSGVRSSLMWALISVFSLPIVYAPEIGSKITRARIAGAVAATGTLGILAVFALSIYYPGALSPRAAFYQQTMLPSSPTYELSTRVWTYPVDEFRKAFDFPNWPLGNGIGTSSLGTQYVTRIFGVTPTAVGVESGYGNLILEMGVPGLLLWLAWTGGLLVAQWKVVRRLRGTALFPLGLVIFWFSFIILIPGMANGLALENYIINVYVYLLSGVLFGLAALRDTDRHMYTYPSEKAAGAALSAAG